MGNTGSNPDDSARVLGWLNLVFVGVAAIILVMGIVAFRTHYALEEERALNRIRDRVVDRAAALDARLGSVTYQVDSMRVWAQGMLSAPERLPRSPLFSALSDSPASNTFTLDDLPTGVAMAVGNVLGLGSIRDMGEPMARETDMALWMFAQQHSALRASPEVARFYYVSARSMVFVAPWMPSNHLIRKTGVTDTAGAVVALLSSDFVRAMEPERNPARLPGWIPPSAGENVVTYAAPVFEEDTYRGVVAAGLDLSFLRDSLSVMTGGMGRASLITRSPAGQAGALVADSREKEGGSHEVPIDGTRMAELVDSGFRRVDGSWLLSLPLTIAPWAVVVTIPDYRVTEIILPAFAPWVVGAILSVFSLGGLYLVMRRSVLHRMASERALKAAHDKAVAASRAKSDFLATMSHEIRTPMNGIIGMVQLLRASQLEPEQAEQVDTICHSSRVLQFLLNDILDLSKLEAGKLELDIKPFDLYALIDAVLELFRPQAEQKGLVLTAMVADGVPQWLKGDVMRLNQVISNLLSNAVKFTSAGHVALSVHPGRQCGIRVEVTDTGIGIPQETRSALFRPFEQGAASVSGRFGGTGLGLAISRRLVELHDGRIGVEDHDGGTHDGGGACFWLELPLETAPAQCIPADEPVPLASAAAMAASSPGLDLLLAEDNEINRKVISAGLRRFGHRITFAPDGRQAVEMASVGQFDAILMDIRMPVMDGLQAARAIRGLPAPQGVVPILALTAAAYESDIRDCMAAGMNDYLPKPVDFNQLARALSRLCPEKTVAVPGTFDKAQYDSYEKLIGPDAMAEVRERFKVTRSDLARALDDPGNPDGVAWAAHATAGCARYLGFVALEQACRELEKACRSGSGLADPIRRVADLLGAEVIPDPGECNSPGSGITPP